MRISPAFTLVLVAGIIQTGAAIDTHSKSVHSQKVNAAAMQDATLARLQGAAKLANRSAYAWEATALQMALTAHDYPTAHQIADSLNRSPEAGWEARYFQALFPMGPYSVDPKLGPLGTVQFSPDGKLMVSLTEGIRNSHAQVAQIWGFGGDHKATLEGVWNIHFTPDSRQLVTTGLGADKVKVWDASTGKLIREYPKPQPSELMAAANGRFLVQGFQPTWFEWTDMATGKSTRITPGGTFFFVSPNGSYLVASPTHEGLSIISSETGKETCRLALPPSKRRGGYVDYDQIKVAFSSDSSKIGVAMNDGGCYVFSAKTGLLIADCSGGWGSVRYLKFSDDGTRLAAIWDGRDLCIYSSDQGRKLATIYPPGLKINFYGNLESPTDVSISRDSLRVMALNRDGTVGLWQLPVAPNRAHLVPAGASYYEQMAGQPESEQTEPDCILRGHGGPITGAAFSPLGWHIVTSSEDGTLRFWDFHDLDPVKQLRGHEYAVKQAVFSPNGKFACTSSEDGTARIWTAGYGDQVAVLAKHKFQVSASSFSPDSSLLATASQDGTAILWSAKTWQPIRTLSGHRFGINSVQFSPDGKHLLTGSQDGTAMIWNVASGNSMVLAGHKFAVVTASYSADGKWVVTASADGTACVWDAATGKRVQTLAGHRLALNSASFSPNGKWIVTASEDGTARIWNTSTGKAVHVLKDQGWAVKCAAFSPTGWQVVTACADGSAAVWKVSTGEKFVSLSGHTDAITSVSFSPDGNRILTSSEDKTARLWDSVTGRQVACLTGHLRGVSSSEFSHDGSLIVTASKDCSARIWYSYSRLNY